VSVWRALQSGNAYLRFVAVIFAQNCVNGKKDTPFKRRYARLYHAHDRNEIMVMLARDFLAVVYAMWRHQTAWQAASEPQRRSTTSAA
jgi:hypothetical protein